MLVRFLGAQTRISQPRPRIEPRPVKTCCPAALIVVSGLRSRLGARARRPAPNGAIWLLLVSVVLTGCATLIQQTEHGRWVEIGPETALTLHQRISIPQDRARVFFKNGRLSRSGASYRASCALEVRRISRTGPQSISAGRFQITRAQHYWTEVAARLQDWSVFVQHAELSNGGGQPLIQTGYRFWLERADTPNLMHLTCLGILAEPADAYPPTISELRRALGELATLDLG